MRDLLERDGQLDALRAAYAAVRRGPGRLVFVLGEAGAGKTALVRQFTAPLPAPAVLFGACDPLDTPRPLGPLLDMAPALARRAGRPVPDAAAREDLFAFISRTLAAAGDPPVLVFEDVHWADQATLDLLRYTGRRLDRVHALLVATLRDTEVTAGGPVALLLGDLATAAGVERLAVPPLSLPGTADLVAGTALDPGTVYELTGGNPYFIGEVVSAGIEAVPPTVRDTVLARVTRLSGAGREALEAAAAIGGLPEPALLRAVMDRSGTPRWGLDEAAVAGLLVPRDGALAFRHELARSAIADATGPARRQRLHALVLAELRTRPRRDGDHGELVRHAEAAGDDESVRELAPVAAERAARLNAHREAAALLGKAADRSHGRPPAERAGLLERQAGELYLSAAFEAAIAAHQEAARIRSAVAHDPEHAWNLTRISSLCFFAGRYEDGQAALRTALEILRALPPGQELARAHEAEARVRFMEQDYRGAVGLAVLAEGIADGAGDEQTALDARITTSAALLQTGDERGERGLEAGLAEARSRGLPDAVARATLYLGWIPVLNRQYRGVEARLAEGLAFAAERDFGYWELMFASARARWALDQGRWHEVEPRARAVLARREAVSLARVQALVTWGRLLARRGDPDAAGVLDQAVALATEHDRVEPVARTWPARAEAAWLAGQPERVLAGAREARASCPAIDNPWWHGELAFWVHAAGGQPAPAPALAEPYERSLAGDWEGAARWWREAGCRYEAATALLLAPEPGPIREALDELDGMGARPAADQARRRLRELGVTGFPRGPRASTLRSPAGLTRREHDVLLLVAAGMSNSEIARRLFLSPKTVERHLAGIFRKLDASSRVEAAAAASRLGLLRPRAN